MRKLISLILISYSFTVSAQTEADISKHFTEVNKQIAESIELGYEGPLYQNQLIINKNIKSWPAAGYYTDTVNFWYDDNPDHLPATERKPENVLLKVNNNRKASHLITNEEYLYKDGKLLFYYSLAGEEGNVWETRVYFNSKGLMIKSSVKANGKELTAKDFLTEEYRDFKPNPVVVKAAAIKYQDLFLKSM
jgi:hypothetical protein